MAETILRACKDGRTGESYILGGDQINMKEVFDILSAHTGLPTIKTILPASVGRMIGKLSDVAERLGSNRNSISACINNQLNCSFSQFIGKYRVEYAQQLMRNKPDMKTTEVWMQSGFTTEVSFFRTFKAFTGMTPNEWRACGEQ